MPSAQSQPRTGVEDDPLLADLNPEQREAVTAPPGPLLVLAGAGSGKTRVLTRRLAHLIREGADPRSILAITFTNKAAREMAERTAALLGPMAHGMWVQTFHSACARILRRHIGFGYTAQFTVLDGDDQRTVVREVLRELGYSERMFPPNALQAQISRAKQDLHDAEWMRASARDPWTQKAAVAFARYQDKLRASNCLDFDDLIALVVRLLEEGGDAAVEALGFRHVLVDEYQDTNHAQYRLVLALARGHRSLTVVGDEDQSIYGFRGADVSNIRRFEQDFPEARVVRLERNYRSTQSILDAAGSVIGHNPRRYPKRLWTDGGKGERVVVYRAWDPGDEAAWVARQIAELRPTARAWGEFCVLYRTHAQSRALEEALMARGVPYVVVGGLRFYDRKEVRDAIAYLRLLCNPCDWPSFRRAVAVPRRGVGEATLNALAEHMAATGETLPSVLVHAQDVPGAARAAKTLRAFADLLDRLRSEAEGADTPDAPGRGRPAEVAEVVASVLDRSGMLAELREDDSIEARARIENLEELVNVARQSAPTLGTGLPGVELFLERAALLSEADAVPDGGEGLAGTGADAPPRSAQAVVLMTLHAVKGLEYPYVFLVGMEEGVFPHARAQDHPDGVEEERRLCYVGMTRARRRLFLSYAMERGFAGGSPQPTRPSRFLQEIERGLVEERGPAARRDAGGLWRRSPPASRVPAGLPLTAGHAAAGTAEGLVDVAVGDRVVHPRWGEGTVVGTRGRGIEGEVTVDFADAGRRTLVLAYARLRRAGAR